MGIDYYAVLDLSRNCTDVEIKLAYRNFALRTHPNRKEYQQHPKKYSDCVVTLPLPKLPEGTYWEYINEAYHVLIDPLLRHIYDFFGEEGLKSGVACPNGFIEPFIYHGDFMKTYYDVFGTYSPYADLIDAVTNPPPLYSTKDGVGLKIKDKDVEKLLHLDLKEIFFGGMKKMKISRKEFVDANETKTEIRDALLTIPITPGVLAGTKIVFESAGDQTPTRFPADVIFIVCDKPHPIFRRSNGHDLLMDYKITLIEALTGFTMFIRTIDGRKLNIAVTDTVHPKYVKTILSEGLPINDNIQEKGDLHIIFEVEFPKYIPKSIKMKLEDVFKDLQ